MSKSKDFTYYITLGSEETKWSILHQLEDAFKDIDMNEPTDGYIRDWANIDISTDEYSVEDSTYESKHIETYRQIKVVVRGVKP